MAVHRASGLKNTLRHRGVEPCHLISDGGARDSEPVVEGSVHDHDEGADMWTMRDGTSA